MSKLVQEQALIQKKRNDATWKNCFPLRTRQGYFQEKVLFLKKTGCFEEEVSLWNLGLPWSTLRRGVASRKRNFVENRCILKELALVKWIVQSCFKTE